MAEAKEVRQTLKDANYISVLPPASREIQETEKPVDRGPLRNKDGTLTRWGMEQHIERGGSVNVGGRIYTRKQDLPSQEQFSAFVKGQTEALQKTKEELSPKR